MTDRITIERETLERAIEAMLDLPARADREKLADKMRAALAQQAEPQPVACDDEDAPTATEPSKFERLLQTARQTSEYAEERAALAAPPTPAAVPLTDYQVAAALAAWFGVESGFDDRMRAAFAAAHGIAAAGDKP